MDPRFVTLLGFARFCLTLPTWPQLNLVLIFKKLSDGTPERDGDILSLGSIDGYDRDHIRENAWKWKELLHRYFRAQIVGMENCPSRSFVAVGNHSGAVLIPDTLVWLSYYHSSNRYIKPPMLTLAHDAFFDVYPKRITRWASRFGAIRANHANALQGLKRGYAVQVYPGGDFDACRPFGMRNRINLSGRTGYVKLAQQAEFQLFLSSVMEHIKVSSYFVQVEDWLKYWVSIVLCVFKPFQSR